MCVLRGADTLSDNTSVHYSGNPNCWQVSSCRGQIKGGSTDTRNNYQAHRHHPAYWRPLQLYDLGADADEQVNLANDTARAPLLAEMRALLRARLEGDACA